MSARRWRDHLLRQEVLSPLGALAVATGATFVILVISGISRGEVAWLWIFLAAFVAIVAAEVCALEPDPRFFDLIVAGTILLTCLIIGRVGFAVQGLYVPGREGVPEADLTPLTEIALVAAVVLVFLGLRSRAPALLGSTRSTTPTRTTYARIADRIVADESRAHGAAREQGLMP